MHLDGSLLITHFIIKSRMAAVEKRFHDPEREAKDREFNEMLKVMNRIENNIDN